MYIENQKLPFREKFPREFTAKNRLLEKIP